MPQRSISEYRSDIHGRTGQGRTDAENRHLELLTHSRGSMERGALSKLAGLKKRVGRDSQGYRQIVTTLEILESAMDEMVTAELEPMVRPGLMDTYATLMQHCDSYLDSHSSRRSTKTGQARVDAIRELRRRAEDEAQLVDTRLTEVGDFQNGITLRQLLAGMRPLDTVRPTAAAFELMPQVQTNAFVMPGDPLVQLHQLQDELRADTEADANTRATVSILLEQADRWYLHGEHKVCADLLDRVTELCGPANGDTLLGRLSQTCQDFKTAKGLEGSGADEVHEGTNRLATGQYAGDDAVGQVFSEYRHMDPAVARYLAGHTKQNEGMDEELIYGADRQGRTTHFGGRHGYIQTSNASAINRYLWDLSGGEDFSRNSIHRDFATLRTIGTIDRASQSTYLPEKTRLHRMLGKAFLERHFGLPGDGMGISPGTVNTINKNAGMIITDDNIMCTGFAVDGMWLGMPVMLTLLCDEGTPVFATRNLAEGEIILGRGTSYMVMGAIMHGDANPLQLPASHLNIHDQFVEGQEMTASMGGLEIFCKVLKKGGPDTANKSQSADAFRAFQAKQQTYVPRYAGTHGDGVHRDAYLEMSRRDQSSLTNQEAAAMDEYTNDSGTINRRLRSGEIAHDVTDAQNTFVKRAFAKHPIPVALDTFRGVSDGFLTYLLETDPSFTEDQKRLARTGEGGLDHTWLEQDDHFKIFEGIVFRDAAFVSTSTNKYFARRWANQVRNDEITRAKGGTVRIGDPVREQDVAGAHVLNMHLPQGTRAMFTDAMFTRTGRPRGQDEVTVDAGYSYSINAVRRVGHGMYEMDVTCVG